MVPLTEMAVDRIFEPEIKVLILRLQSDLVSMVTDVPLLNDLCGNWYSSHK